MSLLQANVSCRLEVSKHKRPREPFRLLNAANIFTAVRDAMSKITGHECGYHTGRPLLLRGVNQSSGEIMPVRARNRSLVINLCTITRSTEEFTLMFPPRQGKSWHKYNYNTRSKCGEFRPIMKGQGPHSSQLVVNCVVLCIVCV
jgi:hypothetical protein